jgi:hypothetical protein
VEIKSKGRDASADWRSIDDAYEKTLAEVLNGIPESDDLRTAAQRGRGLFPAEVKRWFLEHRDHKFPLVDTAWRNDSAPIRPELHMLDGEWYFTDETSRTLADSVPHGSSLLLGVPTVAAAMKEPGSLLIDNSPFILRRFPRSATRWIKADVRTVKPGAGYDAAVVDPPWCMAALYGWMWTASQAVRPGGVIYAPLLGECTRPAAARQRDLLLEYLSASGEVTVDRDLVEYAVPLFEHRALVAASAPVDGPWRRADLLQLRVRTALPAPPAVAEDASVLGDWETYLLGRQVVKLRKPVRSAPGSNLIAPLEALGGYALTSVSRRDGNLRHVDLWTSRNAVAKVLDFAAVRSALRQLGGDKTGLPARAELLRAAQGRRVDALLHILEI